jgi:hypothetical protein
MVRRGSISTLLLAVVNLFLGAKMIAGGAGTAVKGLANGVKGVQNWIKSPGEMLKKRVVEGGDLNRTLASTSTPTPSSNCNCPCRKLPVTNFVHNVKKELKKGDVPSTRLTATANLGPGGGVVVVQTIPKPAPRYVMEQTIIYITPVKTDYSSQRRIVKAPSKPELLLLSNR